MQSIKYLASGFYYVFKGYSLLCHPGFRRYAIIPILLNITIFVSLYYFGLHFIQDWLQGINWSPELPSWLKWLGSFVGAIWSFVRKILIVAVAIGLLFILGTLSTIITNFIASPFNGLLSEKVDNILGQGLPPQPTFAQSILHSIWREVLKLGYYLPKGGLTLLTVGIISFIPIINFLVPIILFLYGAWMLNFEYLDYPADNHQVKIKPLKQLIKQNKALCWGFGIAAMVVTSIPIVNLVVIPALVCGATLLWIETAGFSSNKE